MNNLEKRLFKLEKIIKTQYNHSGAFIILIKNCVLEIQNKKDKGICFDSEQKLEDYIYDKYQCEKYVFITINIPQK